MTERSNFPRRLQELEKMPEGPKKSAAFARLDRDITAKMLKDAGLPPNFRMPVMMGSEDA